MLVLPGIGNNGLFAVIVWPLRVLKSVHTNKSATEYVLSLIRVTGRTTAECYIPAINLCHRSGKAVDMLGQQF